MAPNRRPTGDPFLLRYDESELRIASEFLANWLPFLSKDLCRDCTRTLSNRIQSLSSEYGATEEPSHSEENRSTWTKNGNDKCDTHSLGSWRDEADTHSLGSWKEGANGWSDTPTDGPSELPVCFTTPAESTSHGRMSWADMAQEEDELEAEEREEEADSEARKESEKANGFNEELDLVPKQKIELSREQREYIRFMNVKRKKDFICLERVNGRIMNILQGLELHTGVFSAVEQRRIVNTVYELQEKGRKGVLRDRTYTAPRKWMRGKGRQTIQFGCCYNYATDKNGNPPGILQTELVDPMPPLFKVIIRRLIKWHVLPPSCVPDSCIVNIYEEGDCIPPHIDNHDFLRPFCTISFLCECDIVFGTDLKIVGPGEFSGSYTIPLPVGSVLVLNGNGADLAKHCVPAVPAKRISITFRKMDENKRPHEFVPEPDLQDIEPLCYESEFSSISAPIQHNSSTPMQHNSSTPLQTSSSTPRLNSNSISGQHSSSTPIQNSSSTPILNRSSTPIRNSSSAPILNSSSFGRQNMPYMRQTTNRENYSHPRRSGEPRYSSRSSMQRSGRGPRTRVNLTSQ